MLRAGPKQSKRCAMDEDSALGEIVGFREIELSWVIVMGELTSKRLNNKS